MSGLFWKRTQPDRTWTEFMEIIPPNAARLDSGRVTERNYGSEIIKYKFKIRSQRQQILFPVKNKQSIHQGKEMAQMEFVFAADPKNFDSSFFV